MGAIRQEIIKLRYPAYALLTIIGVVLLCMTGTGYIDTHGKEYTIMGLLANMKALQVQESLLVSNIGVIQAGTGTWFCLFLPVVVSAGYLLILSSEQQHNNRIFMLMRERTSSYCISKAVSLGITTGVLCCIGYAVFMLICTIAFPGLSRFSPEDRQYIFMTVNASSVWEYILKSIVGMFIFGWICALPGYFVGGIFNDKYALVCVPILLTYLYNQLILKLVLGADSELGIRICSIFMFQNVLHMSNLTNQMASVGVIAALWIICVTIYIRMLKSQKKRGVLV